MIQSDAENPDPYTLLSRAFSGDNPDIQWLLKSLDQSSFGILITNPHRSGSPILYANQSTVKMTGYRLDELLNQSPSLLQRHDTDQKGIESLREAIREGQECRVVLRNYRKDGSLFWNEITQIPVRDEQQELKCFVQILNDVSNYERSETEKEIVEDTLRSILNSAEDAIVTINDSGIIQDVNAATEEIFGYAPEELLGENVNVLMPSPYHEQHDGYLKNYLETGVAKVIGLGREVTAKRKDGSTFPAEIAISQVDHKHLFTGIVRDLTERKKSEELLRREHDLNEKIISTSRSIILMLDPECRIIQVNSYFEFLTGSSSSRIKGADFSTLFVAESEREAFQTSFANAIDGETTTELCQSLLTSTGNKLIVDWETVPMTSRTGMVIALLCTGVDVSEQRRLEREVLEIATEEQQRIGQDLHDVVGQELTGMSMLAESLAVSLEKSEDRHVQLAKKIAKGTTEALRKVRLLSKGLNPVDIDAAGLMAALKFIATRTAELHPVGCTFECPKPVLLRDNVVANQIYRIAEEAVTNAIKHAESTEILISLHDTENFLDLRIEDNGIGLKAHNGSGLGLRIMRYRANRMEGLLKIEKSDMGGTSISCRVPTDSTLVKNLDHA